VINVVLNLFFVTGDFCSSPVFEFRDVHIPIIIIATEVALVAIIYFLPFGEVRWGIPHLQMLVFIAALLIILK
jgi:hypothetical protein